jgi:membrane-associated phospholipid phosphatase
MSARYADPAMAQRIPRRLRVARLVDELLSPPPILTDKNISLREQRTRFGVVAITSILLGLVLLAAFDAPAEMVALLAAIAVGVACGWVITLWWKISVHAAIAAGAATVLLLVFGPALLAIWPLLAMIAWSRVQVGDHTTAQVLGGVALGVVVNATVFSVLR